MRFYRRLQPFKAISFDLDDTLYNNAPVLHYAETQLCQRLAGQFPHQACAGSPEYWQQQKALTLAEHAAEQPYLGEDTSAARYATLVHGLAELGHGDPYKGAAQLMAEFYHWRNQITVVPDILNTLLSLNKVYPLAVITNGNAQVEQFLLQIHFASVQSPTFSSHEHAARAKPAPDLFLRCCDELNIAPSELLHVGDHPLADIDGAIQAGCQAALLTPGMNGRTRPLSACLPTFEISQLPELLTLLS